MKRKKCCGNYSGIKTFQHLNSKFAPSLKEISDKSYNANMNNRSMGPTGHQCGLCEGSYWICIVGARTGKPIARRCDCVGGPEAMIRILKKSGNKNDLIMADQIQRQQVGQPYTKWDLLRHGKALKA